jgi:hypothetical protein
VEKVRDDEETDLCVSALGDRSALHWRGITTVCRAARSRWRGREGMTKNDNYAEVTTTTGREPATRWSEVGVGIDDNYRGGDDNYPRLVVNMGDVGRGRNRQK